jgi:hypothetical protein
MSTVNIKWNDFASDNREKVSNVISKFYNTASDFLVGLGYARAASELARQGFQEEAKYLMLGARYHRENTKDE